MQDRPRGERPFNRRVFLRSGIILSGAVLAGSGLLHGAETERKSDEKEAEVGPPEDLMREHGVLKRVLLVYGEALRRLDAKQDLPPEALAEAAGIIRSFVEDYYEKLEEDFLFPRFERANQLLQRLTTGIDLCLHFLNDSQLYEQICDGLRRGSRYSAFYCSYCGLRSGRQLQSPRPFAANGRSKLGAGAKRLSAAGRFDSKSGEHSFGRG